MEVNVEMLFFPICLYVFYDESGNFFFIFFVVFSCAHECTHSLSLSHLLTSRMLYYSIRLSHNIHEKHTASNYVNYIKYSIIFPQRARQRQQQRQRRLFCRQKSVCECLYNLQYRAHEICKLRCEQEKSKTRHYAAFC